MARASGLTRLLKSPPLVAAALSLAALALVAAIRAAGWLEPLELLAHDYYLRAEAVKRAPDDRLVLVGATDEDFNRWGWPLSDAILAKTLEKIEAHDPAAIGIDLYRDAARGEGEVEFRQTMLAHPNIIAVTKIGDGRDSGIPPPAFLEPERIGFADVVLDRGDIVRRGLLFLDDGENTYTGFALRLALLYLQPHGLGVEADPADPARLKIGHHVIPPFEANDGGYVGADAGGYQFLLDYAGGPEPFRRLTLSDVLDDRVPAGTLAGRVIVLGVAGQSVKDFFATPFSVGELGDKTVYGITLHAHIVSQLLRMAKGEDAPLLTWQDRHEAVWLALWSLLGGLLSLALRSPLRFGVAFCLGLAAIFATGHFGMSHRLWVPVVPPALAWVAASLLTVAYLSVLERKQRGQLMQLFSRHVSGEVANEIWKHHEEFLAGSGRPLPQRLDVTILFSDIRGFTSISEQMSPEGLMNWLNEYIGEMADLVIAHGGMVDKFIGDAVMAIFGAPVPHHSRAEIEMDAVKAVECALAMGEAVGRLNMRWQAQGLPPIAIRIGINSGQAVAGSLGSSNRLEYTLIGDAVNTASRLESMDKDWPGLAAGEHCRILVSESTMSCLNGRYAAVNIGSVHLKGKEQNIGVYRITGESAKGTDRRTS